MCVLAKAQVEDFDVVTDSLEQIGDGAQQARNVRGSRSGRVRQSDVAALPRFGIGAAARRGSGHAKTLPYPGRAAWAISRPHGGLAEGWY